MPLDLNREPRGRGRRSACRRCGAPTAIHVQLMARRRTGAGQNGPGQSLGSVQGTFCESCAVVVFDAAEAIVAESKP